MYILRVRWCICADQIGRHGKRHACTCREYSSNMFLSRHYWWISKLLVCLKKYTLCHVPMIAHKHTIEWIHRSLVGPQRTSVPPGDEPTNFPATNFQGETLPCTPEKRLFGSCFAVLPWELTYFTLGKGKSSSKGPAGRGYLSFQEAIFLFTVFTSVFWCIDNCSLSWDHFEDGWCRKHPSPRIFQQKKSTLPETI